METLVPLVFPHQTSPSSSYQKREKNFLKHFPLTMFSMPTVTAARSRPDRNYCSNFFIRSYVLFWKYAASLFFFSQAFWRKSFSCLHRASRIKQTIAIVAGWLVACVALDWTEKQSYFETCIRILIKLILLKIGDGGKNSIFVINISSIDGQFMSS